MMDGPIQKAFDAVLELKERVEQAEGMRMSEEDHRKYMDIARDLMSLGVAQ